MADIEAMFYQVKVPKEDCDYFRFLWWPNGDIDKQAVPFRMVVHLFGATSSPSCANAALRKAVEDHSGEFPVEISEVMSKSFYVDDCLVSVESQSKAIKLIDGLTSICERGGFRLTKWVSNDRKILESIPEEEKAKDFKNLPLNCDSLPTERALGVQWSVERDTIGFNIKIRSHSATRRGILSTVSSVYDPFGLASPFVLPAKLILQDLCRLKTNWDEKVTGRNLTKWEQWLTDLPQLDKIEVNRCYKPSGFNEVSNCQLHVFSDASDSGYGVAVYLRLTDKDERRHCCLVMGRSRVAPLKKVSIPRMELTAATMAVRLSRMIVRELDYHIDRVLFWTDSMSVLRYIANESTRFHTFVANRVAMIRDGSEPDQWRYIESKLNPADCASRGLTFNQLQDHTEWLDGPNFLWIPESEWPVNDQAFNGTQLLGNDPEVNKITTNVAQVNNDDSPLSKLIDRQSSWVKLRSVLGWVLMAVSKFKKRQPVKGKIIGIKDVKRDMKSVHLPFSFVQMAETVLIKHTQKKYFKAEIDILNSVENNDSSKLGKSNPLRKLNPFLDNGILRVGGRLSHANIPFNARHPIFLPKDSRVSQLYLEYIHASVGHLGKNSMLAALRQKYWITGASTAIKSLVRRCVICRKYQGRVLEQQMADLPPERLIPNQCPFSSVGMDFFGPFLVKRARSVVKRYGVIFTCLVTRAVHLEMAFSLDTDSCINSIRRLIARRGPVQYIRSDNGTNLVGSERELREELQRWNQSQIHKCLQQKNVRWVFNPPLASHHGGVWERLIRIVRKVLYSLLQQQTVRLDDELLYTLFCEVESILNSRPITEVSSDHTDLEALTPNHLLLMRSGETLPPGQFQKTDNYSNRRWRQVQYLADVFWLRWTKEYLPLLQGRQKWLKPHRNLQLNDIVLVVDTTPRNSWCMGRVIDIHKDTKGMVRSVKIKTKSSCLVRPISKLCLILEASSA